MFMSLYFYFFFFFNDTATTEIYTLSLHDALPICAPEAGRAGRCARRGRAGRGGARSHALLCRGGRSGGRCGGDRKSTRLNSSHSQISYAVFCLKKKKNLIPTTLPLLASLTRHRSY